MGSESSSTSVAEDTACLAFPVPLAPLGRSHLSGPGSGAALPSAPGVAATAPVGQESLSQESLSRRSISGMRVQLACKHLT
jgi:hypothetical protein